MTFRFGFLKIALGLILTGVAHNSYSSPLVTDVFVSSTDGYASYRIPVMVVSTNGTALAFCEGRKNGQSDTGKIDLLLKRSRDAGRSWTAQQVVWSDGENVCGNPAAVVDTATGYIWLLMTWNIGADHEKQIIQGTSKDTRRVFITHSSDDGSTWSKPQDITKEVKRPDWNWYATGPVNGIQLTRGTSTGRMVIPANHSELNSNNQPVTRSHVLYSEDHGTTWHIGGSEEELTNESTVIELSDGSLMHNMRSYHKKNRRAVAISRNAGESWSPVKLDESLIEPVCQGSLLRYSWPSKEVKDTILFSNPASLKRENLTIRLSYDQGSSWPKSKILHAGPSAYSCLTVMPDKTIGCLYEHGEKSPYEKISLATFPITWFEDP